MPPGPLRQKERPRASPSISEPMAMTGMEVLYASAKPEINLMAPQPAVASHTPIPPLITGVGVRGKGGINLILHENMPDTVPLIQNSVVERQSLPAGHTKYRRHTIVGQQAAITFPPCFFIRLSIPF